MHDILAHVEISLSDEVSTARTSVAVISALKMRMGGMGGLVMRLAVIPPERHFPGRTAAGVGGKPSQLDCRLQP